MMQRARDVALTITAVGAAGGTVYGAYTVAGEVLAMSIAVAILAVVGVLAVQRASVMGERILDSVQATERELKINGNEHLLPPEQQGLPLRELVITYIATSTQDESALVAAAKALLTTDATTAAQLVRATAHEVRDAMAAGEAAGYLKAKKEQERTP